MDSVCIVVGVETKVARSVRRRFDPENVSAKFIEQYRSGDALKQRFKSSGNSNGKLWHQLLKMQLLSAAVETNAPRTCVSWAFQRQVTSRSSLSSLRLADPAHCTIRPTETAQAQTNVVHQNQTRAREGRVLCFMYSKHLSTKAKYGRSSSRRLYNRQAPLQRKRP